MSNKLEIIEKINRELGDTVEIKETKTVRLLNSVKELLETDDTKTNLLSIKDELINILNKIDLKDYSDNFKILETILEKINDKETKTDEIERLIKELINAISLVEYPDKIEVINFPEPKDFPTSISIDNFPEQQNKIEVVNFPEQKEYPTEIKISNFPEQQKRIKVDIDKNIGIKKPTWYKPLILQPFVSSIIEALDAISDKIFKIDISKHKKENEAIAVKLVDKDGKFIDKLIPNITVSNPVGSGGPGRTTLYDKNEKPIDSDNPLPVSATLNIGDIEIGAVEIKDGNSDTRLDVELDNVKNAIFVQSESLAKENTLQSVDGSLDTILAGATAIGGVKLVNESGILYGIKHVDNKIRVSSMSYLYDIAEGNVANHIGWTKTGYNEGLGATEEDMWNVGGTYIFPTAEMQMEVVSSSADDTSNGTGVRKVKIWYLDDAGVEKTEEITMNGATPVATTATDIYRINRFRITATGTGLKAAGNIDIRNLADTPIYARISTGMTRARQAIYTVPAGKVLYITSVTMSCGANVSGRLVRFTTRATYDNIADTINSWFTAYTEIYLEDNAITVSLEIPTHFHPLVDIKVSAISPDGAASGNTTLRGWLENE